MNQSIPREGYLKSGIGLVPINLLLLMILPLIHFLASGRVDLPLIWGDRNEAIFDLWSVQHLLSGILIGSFIAVSGRAAKLSRSRILLMMLTLALVWEAIELSMEIGFFGAAVAQWKHGFEHWGNRFIGDPGMFILGGLLARKLKFAWPWILAAESVWLIANIAMPNSMVIQRWLGL